MAGSFVEENTRTRTLLRALLGRLDDQDLARKVDDPWTVAGILAHLAFWDYRSLILLETWKGGEIKPSPVDVDVVNDAMRPLLLAIPPREAARAALDAAEAIDREIEGLSPDFIARVEAQASTFRLNRGSHRGGHVAQIESALAGKG